MPVIDGFLLYQKTKKIDSRMKICFLAASEYYYEHGFSEFKQENC
jgi:hypothetical protein